MCKILIITLSIIIVLSLIILIIIFPLIVTTIITQDAVDDVTGENILDIDGVDEIKEEIYNDLWIMIELPNEKILEFIQDYNTCNEYVRQNLLDNVRTIEQIQEDTGYSAQLIIIIVFEEIELNGSEDMEIEKNCEEILQKLALEAKQWNEKECDNIEEIAELYVGIEKKQEWIDRITAHRKLINNDEETEEKI